MSSGSSSPPPAPGNQYREAIATYRTSVKWVISSFGAVAAALIVGIQLTSLGELHGERLVWALASIGVVFAAILAIIAAAVRVLSPISGTYAGFKSDPAFRPLRDFLALDKTPLRTKANDPGELAAKYEEALGLESEKWRLHNEKKEDKTLEADYQAARSHRAALFPVVQAVTNLGLLLHTKQLFRQAMLVLYVGVALAAAGAVAFAYLANPPAPTKRSTSAEVLISPRLPLNCAGFYLTLDKLLRNEPKIAKAWPTRSVGPQARACGFETKQELTEFLSRFVRH